MLENNVERVVSKPELEFNELMAEVKATAKPEDFATAQSIVNSDGAITTQEFTPAVASVIFTEHNGKNRTVSFGRVYSYRDAMKRKGEWKENHQGVAIYPDGSLADGQHRMAAVALSGTTQSFLVYPNFNKDAIDTIDRSTRRSAGESLEMMGIDNGKLKATLAKVAMGYMNEEKGLKGNFTDPQVEEYVLAHNTMLDEAISIGSNSTENVSDACLSKAVAQTIALLMLEGGWKPNLIVGYVASIQQGVATYPESPTVYLSRVFTKAKYAERRKDKMTKKEMLAVSLKGAALWADEKSVSKVVWNSKKESLPTHNSPALSVAA